MSDTLEPSVESAANRSEPLVSVRVDLHIHSEFSPDSKTPVQDVILAALDARLDVIAITDHYVDKAFALLGSQAYGLPDTCAIETTGEVFVTLTCAGRRLIIIRGKEVSLEDGSHILALAYRGKVSNFMNAAQTLRSIQQKGGLVIVPHPCNTASHGIGTATLTQLLRDPTTNGSVDAVETFNANSYFPMFWANNSAKDAARRLHTAGLSASDAHQARHVGKSSTLLAGSLDPSNDASLVTSFRHLIRHAPRTHHERYVPMSQFLDWFVLPKLEAIVKGAPTRIRPPADFDQY